MHKLNDQVKVERRTLDPNGWYEVMLSPFSCANEAYNYIEKYRQYYPLDQQNYRLTFSYSNQSI